MTFEELTKHRSKEFAEAYFAYFKTDWNRPKSFSTGDTRPLVEEEIKYATAMNKYYKYSAKSILKNKTPEYCNPPKTWDINWKNLKPTIFAPVDNNSFLPPISNTVLLPEIKNNIKYLYEISKRYCFDSRRYGWKALFDDEKKRMSEESLWIVSTCFVKATKGVADKVSVEHFKKIVKRYNNITLEQACDFYTIAPMMRQCSNWVKFSWCLVNLFKYIKDCCNRQFPKELETWIRYREFATKTASLLLYLTCDKLTTIPVDSHVMLAAKNLNLTSASSADEISWQLAQIIPKKDYIKFNDTIGSIRQKLGNRKKKKSLLEKAKKWKPDFYPTLEKLISIKKITLVL